MANIIILKSKQLTIEVNQISESDYDFVALYKGNVKEEYSLNEGKVLKNGEEKLIGMSLYDFAHKEKRKYYIKLLQSRYSEIENLIILSGSGTSVGIGKSQVGLTMNQLWDALRKEKGECLIGLLKEVLPNSINKKDEIIDEGLEKDLERLLSLAGMKRVISNTTALDRWIREAKEFIVGKCTLQLPETAAHIEFLEKIILRPQKSPRAKIFTLNYDTLFEQAAGKEKFTIIDGFTFSSPRLFHGKYFDYDIVETKHNRQDKNDSTISKLFYLFKMHGSLNWRRNSTKTEIEEFDGRNVNVDEIVMIFPQDSKYEHSYEQPYFEMMARFQQALRTSNTLLITIGFSFLDKHISSVILESLKHNPSLNLLTFTYPEVVYAGETAKDYQKELHQITAIQSRVTLVGEKFEDFVREYPENIAHHRFDLLEELNENLKNIKKHDS